MPLQLHLVPLAIINDLLVEPHQPLAAAKVEPILQPALDNLQDAVVDQALSVHQRCHTVHGAKAQTQAEVALHRAFE